MRYVIIGNGVAGLAAAIAIRERDASGLITLVADEPHPPYFRAGLSEWIHGALGDDELHLRPATLFDRLRLRTVAGRASALDVDAHTVTLEDGVVLQWDKLLVATGARPFVPPWPGRELGGVFTYRSWDDCVAIKAAVTAQPDKPVVIVGAGILGLEFAWDCKGLGVPAVMLVREAQVGVPLFDDAAAGKLLQRLVDDGVTVHLEDEVVRFEGKDGAVLAVVTSAGRRIECSAVVVAVGVVPETSLFAGTDIAVERWVKVDGHLRTSHPDVYAAGDVAMVFDRASQSHVPTRTWEPSYWGGRTAGENMAGGSKQVSPGSTTGFRSLPGTEVARGEPPRAPALAMNASLAYDLKYVLLGGFSSQGPGVEAVIDQAPQGLYGYRKLLLRDDVIIGGTFLDDRRHALAYRQLMQERVNVTAFKSRLLQANFDPNLALPPGSFDYYFY